MDTHRRNYLAFLWHAVFLSITVTFTEVNTIIPAMILQVGGSALHIGIASSIMIGIPVVSKLAFSSLLSRYEHKKPFLLIGIGMRVLSLAMIAYLLSSQRFFGLAGLLSLIYFLLLLFSSGGALAGLGYIDLVGSSLGSEGRRKFFTSKQLVGSVGMLLSMLVARQIVSTLSYPVNYILLFSLAAFFLATASGGFFTIREQESEVATPMSYAQVLRSLPGILKKDGSFRNYVILSNILSIGTVLTPFFLSLAKESLSFGSDLLGSLLLFQVSGNIASSLVWRRVIKAGGYKAVLWIRIALSVILPAAAILLVSLLSVEAYLVAIFLVGVLTGARAVSDEAVLVELSTRQNRVLYSGIVGTLNLSMVVLPLLLGFLIRAYGYPVVFLLASGCSLFGFLFLRRMSCPVDKRREASQTRE